MTLTYGMIGDRLSDLVAELNELANESDDFHASSKIARFIGQLDAVRVECDQMVGRAAVELTPPPARPKMPCYCDYAYHKEGH